VGEDSVQEQEQKEGLSMCFEKQQRAQRVTGSFCCLERRVEKKREEETSYHTHKNTRKQKE